MMSISLVLTTAVLLVAAALIPSAAFAQQTNTVPGTTNATSEMTASQLNATDLENRLAQALGVTPEELGARAIQLPPDTIVISLVCPERFTDVEECAIFFGRPQQ